MTLINDNKTGYPIFYSKKEETSVSVYRLAKAPSDRDSVTYMILVQDEGKESNTVTFHRCYTAEKDLSIEDDSVFITLGIDAINRYEAENLS